MEVVRIQNDDQGFKPVTLKLTLQSKEEVAELWHRLNASPDFFKTYFSSDSNFTAKDVRGHLFCTEGMQELFNSIDDIVEEQDIEI